MYEVGMAKKKKRLTRKQRRALQETAGVRDLGRQVSQRPEILEHKKQIEGVAKAAGITPEDMANGLGPEQLKKLGEAIAQSGGAPTSSQVREAEQTLVWGGEPPEFGLASDESRQAEKHTPLPQEGGSVVGEIPRQDLQRHVPPTSVDWANRGAVQKGKSSALPTYLALLGNALSGSRNKNSTRQQAGRRMWADLREARIIEIPGLLFSTLYYELDRFVTTKVGGLPWLEPGEAPSPKEEAEIDTDYAAFYDRIYKEGRKIPFPEKLPFPSVYLGFDRPVVFPQGSVGFDIRSYPAITKAVGEIVRVAVCGILVCERGLITEALLYTNANGQSILADYWVYEKQDGTLSEQEAGWLQPYSLNPWLVPLLIDYINAHQTLVLEDPTLTRQNQWNQARKKLGIKKPLPPPYYTIVIRDKIIEEKVRGLGKGPGSPLSYRHDVRAHESVRIARGDLPLDEKLRKKLAVNPNRRIYTTEPLSAEDASRLAKRGVRPKRHDEWLSILVAQVTAHISPSDTKLPYIPGVRKFPKKRRQASDPNPERRQ